MDCRVGTIAGQIIGGTVENCYAVGVNINTQVGTQNGVAGGLVGANYAGKVYHSYTSDVTIAAGRVGGVVGDYRGDIGENDRPGTVLNCWTDAAQVTSKQTGATYYILACNANASAALASGEAVWNLNLESSDGVWKQTLGTDALPNFTGETVYQVKKCDGTTDAYSNTNAQLGHVYENGKCTVCGAYQPTPLVDGVYQIGNLGQLMWFAQNVKTAHKAILTADITIDNSVVWTPIALEDGTANSSSFDGQGHTITFANTNAGSTFGLFSRYNYSVIENLYLAGSITCNTTDNVGVLVNSAYRTTIRNVISTCDITNSATSGGTGGLAGQFGGQNSGELYSLIENCAVYANVQGGGSAGGFIGNIWGGNQYCTVRNCAYVGNVAGSVNSGAIAGANGNNSSTTSTLSNVYFCETNGSGWIGSAGSSTPSLTDVEAKTAEAFASGEVAYLLGEAWGQDIGTDAYPVLGGQKIYSYLKCDTVTALYTNNSELSGTTATHNFANGFCIACDGYQPAALNKDGIYEISNAGQLYWFAQQIAETNNAIDAILIANIVVNEGTINAESINARVWTPIGLYSADYSTNYIGTFNGNGKTVSGLYFNDSNTNFVGLFGYVGDAGKVSNVGVINSYLCGGERVGGVAGFNRGSVTNCYNTGAVSGDNSIGGVVGENCGTVSGCYNTGAVSSEKDAGGVVGFNFGKMDNCYNTGAVSGDSSIGGVAGGNGNGGTITNCYNTGTVSGRILVGGVTGSNNNGATVSNCYTTGTVNGTSLYNVGGVAGSNNGTVSNCYYLNTTFDGGINRKDVTGSAEAKTAAQFASGEVAYLLQGEQETHVWGQNIGTEDYPVFGGRKVRFDQETNTYYNDAAILGDLDMDGDVDAYDLTILARHVAGIETLTDATALKNADVDGDGDVDAYDLTMHARFVAGIITEWERVTS